MIVSSRVHGCPAPATTMNASQPIVLLLSAAIWALSRVRIPLLPVVR